MRPSNKKAKAPRFSGGENAAAAKARCMYADRLTKDDYKELIMCNSAGEAASYLNTKRRYADALKDERAISGMHREQIEYMLEKRKYGDYMKLSSYLLGSGGYIRHFFTARREVSLIVHAVSSVCSGNNDEYYYLMLSDFDKESPIDISSLSEAKTYDDILNACKNTGYVRVMKKYLPKDSSLPDIVHLEADLWNLLFDEIFQRVDLLPSKSEQKEVSDVFKSYIDAKNISAISRFLNYAECDEEYVMKSLIKHGSISEKSLHNIFLKSKAESLQSDKTLDKYISNGYDSETRICEKKCRKYLRYSSHPAITVLSYLYLLETELANIIKIVEGIRYSLAKEKIAAMISEE
jgi:V/A-type H+-transporting ATPase subunit C